MADDFITWWNVNEMKKKTLKWRSVITKPNDEDSKLAIVQMNQGDPLPLRRCLKASCSSAALAYPNRVKEWREIIGQADK